MVTIYALLDTKYPDRVYYVGRTAQLAIRIARHRNKCDKATKFWITQVYLSGSSLTHKVLETATKRNANTCERKWIRFHTTEFLLNLQSRLPRWFDFGSGSPAPILTLAVIEARYIHHVLTLTGGNKLETARLLGIARQTLYNKLAANPTTAREA